MGMTITNQPADHAFMSTIALPDSGQIVAVTGALNPSMPNETSFTGSPITVPVAPGSGSTYWLIEVNTATGALDMQQSNSSMPTNNAGCITIFQQTLVSGNNDEALVPTDVTPDV